jgi:hypothetical protein
LWLLVNCDTYNITSNYFFFLGSLKLCGQQMKLFMEKVNKKKAEANKFDAEDEEESADVSDDKDSSDSNEDQSSESSDEGLHIDANEEICMNN